MFYPRRDEELGKGQVYITPERARTISSCIINIPGLYKSLAS